MKIRTYTELITIPTFEERFDYLKIFGSVGLGSFGFDRWIEEKFYSSNEWKKVRNHIILRDNGCDLGIPDREIGKRIVVHHMNPVTLDDISNNVDAILNPEYLICVSEITHKAIHYGNKDLLIKDYEPRKPNDTIPWR